MLPSKIRVASLATVVLFAWVAVCPCSFFLCMGAQEPGKPEARDVKIKELQKERLLAAQELAKQLTQRLRGGIDCAHELLESIRMLMDAELDVCDSDKERIAVLERILATAKDIERLAKQFADVRQQRPTAALVARAEPNHPANK